MNEEYIVPLSALREINAIVFEGNQAVLRGTDCWIYEYHRDADREFQKDLRLMMEAILNKKRVPKELAAFNKKHKVIGGFKS